VSGGGSIVDASAGSRHADHSGKACGRRGGVVGMWEYAVWGGRVGDAKATSKVSRAAQHRAKVTVKSEDTITLCERPPAKIKRGEQERHTRSRLIHFKN